MTYKTKTLDDGRIELSWHGENVITILGLYDSQEELEEYRARIQKQEERGKFLTHTGKTRPHNFSK